MNNNETSNQIYAAEKSCIIIVITANETDYRGTSASVGMEVEAVEILWNQYMERGFCYTTTVYDGDSKSFKHPTNFHVYGDVKLHKEECINHVTMSPNKSAQPCASWQHLARRVGSLSEDGVSAG